MSALLSLRSRAVAVSLLLGATGLASRLHAAEPPAAVAGVTASMPNGADVNQGAASASLPFELPTGRGITPSLGLVYSAGGGLGDAGYGWSLSVPAIERAPLSGWPTYDDPDEGKALVPAGKEKKTKCKKWAPIDRIPGSPFSTRECLEVVVDTEAEPAVDRFTYGGAALVPICSLSEPCADTALPTWAVTEKWHYYRLQHDNFTKFFWSPGGRTWRVIDKNGTTTEFGEPTVAKGVVANAVDDDRNKKGYAKPFRWLLSRQYDAIRVGAGTPPNLVAFRWEPKPFRRQLIDIFYTPPVGASSGLDDERAYAHHVALTWKDAFADIPGGRAYQQQPPAAYIWRAQPGSRLVNVEVSSILTPGSKRTMTRLYELGYEFRGVAPKPYLRWFTQRGRCKEAPTEQDIPVTDDRRTGPPTIARLPESAKQCPALPTITLDYAQSTVAESVPWSRIRVGAHTNYFFSGDYDSRAVPIDVTNDGITDFVLARRNDTRPGSLQYKSQHLFINRRWPGTQPGPGVERDLDEQTIGVDSTWLSRSLLTVNRGASNLDAWSPFGSASVFFVAPYSECTPADVADGKCDMTVDDPIFAAERGYGQGWVWKKIGQHEHDGQMLARHHQIGDIDGDGFADRRWLMGTPQGQCEAQIKFPDRDASGKIHPVNGRLVCGNRPDRDSPERKMLRSMLADMNADGLADLLVLWWYSAPDKAPALSYFLGNGTGSFFTEVDVLRDGPAPMRPAGTPYLMPTWNYYLDDPSQMYPVDVNGDGYADIITKPRIARGPDERVFDLWINMGGGVFTKKRTIGYPPITSGSETDAPDFGDFDGDGALDLAVATSHDGVFYTSFRSGLPDNLLSSIDNGLGHVTQFEYDNTAALDEAAEAAGDAWTSHAPRVTYVVTARTDTVSGPADVARKTRTEYTYRNPAWDGWKRRLSGFETVRATTSGDARDPASTVETHYFFSPCHQLPVRPGLNCGGAHVLDNDPSDAQEGWPTWSAVSDAAGTTLLTTIWEPTVPAPTAAGRDGRKSFFSYVHSTYTLLGDPSAQGSSWVTRVIREGSTPDCTPTRVCPDGIPPVVVSVKVPKRSTWLRSRQVVDMANGNLLMTHDDGQIKDDGSPIDETITRENTWEQVSPESNWLFRRKTTSVHAFALKSGRPKGYSRTLTFTNNSLGQLTDVWAKLEGTIPLDRRHEDATREIAPTLATASADGNVHLAHMDLGAYGGVWRTTMPETGACTETDLDVTYEDHAKKTLVYTQPNCMGFPTLVGAIGDYDRGFATATVMTDSELSTTKLELDEFGRAKNVYLPDAETGTAALAVGIEHKFNTSSQRAFTKTTVQLGEGKTRVTVTHFDGSGLPVLSLSPAGENAPVAGVPGNDWIASGLPLRSAKGNVVESFEPWAWSGDPTQHPLDRPASLKKATTKRDALGHVLETTAIDGQTRTVYGYAPLRVDVHDAENLDGTHRKGQRHLYMDGHGRTVRVLAQGMSDGKPREIETRMDYQATGELAGITQSNSDGGRTITRWMQHDSLGRLLLNAEPNTSTDFARDPPPDGVSFGTMRAWRYAYDDAGRLVGTSDARGCGKNLAYDLLGRLTGEDYSPCLKTHEPYTSANFYSGDRTEVSNVYTRQGAPLVTRDRGASTRFSYDRRGHVTDVRKQIAKPISPVPLYLDERYATRVFHTHSTYDFAGRLVRQSSGADVDALLPFDADVNAPASDITFEYAERGHVRHVGSSYGTLMKSTKLDVDGFVREILYGDTADHDEVETLATLEPDDLRRVHSGTLTHPSGTPASYTAVSTATRQMTLAAWTYERDRVGNVTKILDGRAVDEWEDGAKPVTRTFTYDDFYRLTDVTYAHPSSAGDLQKDAAGPGAPPRSALAMRVESQHFTYAGDGNTTSATSDTLGFLSPVAGFYDRNLGKIVNGESAQSDRGPNQLTAAAPAVTPGGTASLGDGLRARYDDAGNMVELRVARSTCGDTSGLCSHVFVYDWDEIGNLARARRWDSATVDLAGSAASLPATSEVDLEYAYSGSQRVRKTAVVGADERHTIDVFGSLRLKNTIWSGTTNDYERSATIEQVYLGGLAHVTVFENDVEGDASGRRHVLFTLGDELGSTSVIVDKHTGELVERATYQAYGAPDSDYRPARWGSFREDFRFTGKEDDSEVGLTYFGARYYHAQLGRWISADPLTVHAVGADLNPYAYVRGSPVNLVDPNGLEDCPPNADDKNAACRAQKPGDKREPGGGGPPVHERPGDPPRGCEPNPIGGGCLPPGAGNGSPGVTGHHPAPPPPPPPKLVPYNPAGGGVAPSIDASRTVRTWVTTDPDGFGDALEVERRDTSEDLPRQSFRELAEKVTGKSFGSADRTDLVPAIGALAAQAIVTAIAPPAGVALAAPTFAVDIDLLAINAARVETFTGEFFNVVTHADPTAAWVLKDGAWVKMGHRALARFIQGAEGYTGGPVRLVACEAGQCAFGLARNLANKLGVKVLGSTETVYVAADGTVTTPGIWRTFFPGLL